MASEEGATVAQSTNVNQVAASEREDAVNVGYSFACTCYDFVIEAVLMGALCLFGFVGNTISMLCLHRDQSKTATPFLLFSLEIVDTLFLAVVFLIRVIASIHTFAVPLLWLTPLVPYLTKYVYPMALVAETGTIYLTILVTVNRYISVCWPYHASDWCSVRCARCHVVAVVLFSAAFNLPRFFEYDIVADGRQSTAAPSPIILAGVGNRTLTWFDSVGDADFGFSVQPLQLADDSTAEIVFEHVALPTETGEESQGVHDPITTTVGDFGAEKLAGIRLTPMALNRAYRMMYSNLLYFVVLFLLPLVLLTFLNQRLSAELRRTRRKRARLRGQPNGHLVVVVTSNCRSGGCGNRLRSSEEDITMMLIVVVIAFVVTQTPAAVTQALDSVLDPSSTACPSAFFFYARISDLLVVANSSVNFLIYCLCSRRFRHILSTVMRVRLPNNVDERQVNNSNTNVELQRCNRQQLSSR